MRKLGLSFFPVLCCWPQHFPFFLNLPHLITCADSGHALEAGWFLLQFSAEWGDEELQRTAIDKFVELPYQYGWDKEHGGLLYFLDVDGHCPTQVNKSFLEVVDDVASGCHGRYCLHSVDHQG